MRLELYVHVRTPFSRLDAGAEGTLRHLLGGALRTQSIHVAAKLGVADQLALGPRTAEDIAQRVGAHAPTLKRVLRFLVSSGVFTEQEDGRFALNALAEYLQTAHPRSMRPSAVRAGEGLWEVAGRLLAAVETGRTPHDEVHGIAFFDRVSAADVAARMRGSSGGLGAALAALPSLAEVKRVVDVGGGDGTVLLDLLRARPGLEGVLFERPSVIEVARERVGDRCHLVAGDFFESVPPADVYLLSWVLHDWEDEKATRILSLCRGARVLIVETILPDRVETTTAAPGVLTDPYTLDMQMLLLTGGRERTFNEYRDLLQRAGFRTVNVTALDSFRGASAIDAV
jgi:hypothetical protein